MEKINIEKKMNDIAKRLLAIPNMKFNDPTRKEYDKVGFVHDLDFLVRQIEYFYQLALKQKQPPSKTFYQPSSIPKEHQVAYFNLTKSFPKELYGGHFCYIIKNFKTKMWVIPITSVKDENKPLGDFEHPIIIKGFKKSVLQLNDMRTLDIQRLYVKKGFFDVENDREEILSLIRNLLETVDKETTIV